MISYTVPTIGPVSFSYKSLRQDYLRYVGMTDAMFLDKLPQIIRGLRYVG